MQFSIRAMTLLTVSGISIFAFQNCGPSGYVYNRAGSASSALASLASCEEIVKRTYSTTYFPLLSSNCNACHANAHGSTDLETSYSGFKTKGITLIDFQATHPHGGNGLDLTNQIASLKADWDNGQAQYTACVANPGSAAPVTPTTPAPTVTTMPPVVVTPTTMPPSTTPTTMPPASAPVTYTQLAATGGVFRTQCFSCHSGGFFDMTTYATVSSAANTAKILNRIQDANSPMPRSGLMPAAQIDLVKSWVAGGAKQ